MTDRGPAELDISPARPSPWRNLSFVWLVPILALVVSLGVAWRSFSERGVLIEISFLNASGVTAGETTIRYRDVVIGTGSRSAGTDAASTSSVQREPCCTTTANGGATSTMV